MARVDGSAIDGVDKLAVWTHCFKQSLVFGVHEIVLNGMQRSVDLFCQSGVVDGHTQSRCRVDEYHRERMALALHVRQVLGRQ